MILPSCSDEEKTQIFHPCSSRFFVSKRAEDIKAVLLSVKCCVTQVVFSDK